MSLPNLGTMHLPTEGQGAPQRRTLPFLGFMGQKFELPILVKGSVAVSAMEHLQQFERDVALVNTVSRARHQKMLNAPINEAGRQAGWDLPAPTMG